jgi:hypothetical protein
LYSYSGNAELLPALSVMKIVTRLRLWAQRRRSGRHPDTSGKAATLLTSWQAGAQQAAPLPCIRSIASAIDGGPTTAATKPGFDNAPHTMC